MKKLLLVSALVASFNAHAVPLDTSVYLYNNTTNQVVVDQNSLVHRPIASVTKLMTAMVTLDNDPDLTKKMYVPSGAKLTHGFQSRQDVLTALLVKSDNMAAEAIASDYPGGRPAFIKAMNAKASQIGLTSTSFEDPSGLSPNNISTAYEISLMMQEATAYSIIKEISTKQEVTIPHQGKSKTKNIILSSTNRVMLSQLSDVVINKTGFTKLAGWNVGLQINHNGQNYAIVVLGAKSKQHRLSIVNDIKNTYFEP